MCIARTSGVSIRGHEQAARTVAFASLLPRRPSLRRGFSRLALPLLIRINFQVGGALCTSVLLSND